MTTPRDLVCATCWNGLFNTQAYQDLFHSPDHDDGSSEVLRQATQLTTSRQVRDNCPFVLIRQDISWSRRFQRTEVDDVPAIETKCNWCEYLGGYTTCELDEDRNPPADEEDLLQVILAAVRVDGSTPVGFAGSGGKVLHLELNRCRRRTGEMLVSTSALHHAYTPAADPAAEVVVSRPLRNDTTSEEAAGQIRSWARQCESEKCGKGGGFYKETALPARLIAVGPEGASDVRVVDTQGSSGVYATLDHCWAREGNMALRRDTLAQLQRSINLGALPRAIEDAIAATRKAGIPYLWVDALCIVQDDEAEMAEQMERLPEIYSRSAVTIAISLGAFTNPANRNDDIYRQGAVLIPVRLAPGKFGTMSLINLNHGILYDNSWERIPTDALHMHTKVLPQRILGFTGQNHTMTWSCPHAPLTRAFGDSMYLPYYPGSARERKRTFTERQRLFRLSRRTPF